MSAERLDVLLAAARIDDVAARHPELFETKVRATGIWWRCACWMAGILIGTIVDRLLTGSAHNPFPMMGGMLLAAVFVYFDPPAITKIRKLKASADTRPEGGDAQ